MAQESSSVMSDAAAQSGNATHSKENILALRDFVQSAQCKFNMNDPWAEPSCGSAGCIGGHAAAMWPEVRRYFGSTRIFTWCPEELAGKLGITDGQLYVLCHPSGISYPDVTREHAVTILTTLAETGVVDWSPVRASLECDPAKCSHTDDTTTRSEAERP